MTLDVAVMIGTFGDRATWYPLAERAMASAFAAGAPAVRHYHGSALHDARNSAVWVVPEGEHQPEWLCFLDADDELEPGYFDAMAQGDTDLRAPLVRYVTSRFSKAAPKIPEGTDDMAEGNKLVIGTLIRKER